MNDSMTYVVTVNGVTEWFKTLSDVYLYLTCEVNIDSTTDWYVKKYTGVESVDITNYFYNDLPMKW